MAAEGPEAGVPLLHEDLEEKLEEIFEKADVLMIKRKNYADAVI
jgi:hypothetical protein